MIIYENIADFGLENMIDSPIDPWEHGFGKLRDS